MLQRLVVAMGIKKLDLLGLAWNSQGFRVIVTNVRM